MQSLSQTEASFAIGEQNLPGRDQQLESEINQEFQGILFLPDNDAKRGAFHRMSSLVAQRRADYVKALEGHWGGCNES